jgi:hypothetical protein
MAETKVQANNVAVKFRGSGEREMPMVSKAQNGAMHAAEEGKSTLGIPASVGKKFVKASHGEKVKRLPMHVKHAVKRGLVSEKQLAKMKD